MVEGNDDTKPAAPFKKFYKKEATKELNDATVPLIPPRPSLGPKLPMRPSNNNVKTKIISINSYPLEDNIYTGLKPELTASKFYYPNPNVTIQQNGQLAVDFNLKAFKGDVVIGLQQGKIVVLGLNKMVSVNCCLSESANRQFYELIPLNQNSYSFLAFQDTGNVFKVQISDENNLIIKLILRGSIQFGTCKIILRPEVEEIWAIGTRETSILSINKKGEDVVLMLIKRVASHFPESIDLTFLGPEDLAVVKMDRSVQVFTISRFSHQPALTAILPPAIGEIIKILKISTAAYGTVYSDGKMIIWKFEKDRIKEKVTVPLTLFRIQTVHVVSDLIWLGLANGKILVLKIGEGEQRILGEMKFHQMTVTKFIKGEGGFLGSLDTSGQFCLWDENLTFYKQSKLWFFK